MAAARRSSSGASAARCARPASAEAARVLVGPRRAVGERLGRPLVQRPRVGLAQHAVDGHLDVVEAGPHQALARADVGETGVDEEAPVAGDPLAHQRVVRVLAGDPHGFAQRARARRVHRRVGVDVRQDVLGMQLRRAGVAVHRRGERIGRRPFALARL
ncbi:MAG TPA: hypothetical protein PKC20_08525, partial [Burkholderiaceae bacterium]|nr:hypothetical protein [Burkholderiaceae bacterium]